MKGIKNNSSDIIYRSNQLTDSQHMSYLNNNYPQGTVNLTLSANHPVHPCVPAKSRAHAYTQNCARMNRESPENAHARAQQHTHLYNYFLACMNNNSDPQQSS